LQIFHGVEDLQGCSNALPCRFFPLPGGVRATPLIDLQAALFALRPS